MKEDKFLRMSVPLPSLDEQRRIVEKLDRVAALVDTAKSLRAQANKDATKLLERLHFEFSSEQELPLGEYIFLAEDKVEVVADQLYPQVGIRGFAGGLFFKEATAGSDTSYKSFNLLHPDMLVVSQPKGWEGAVAVTTDIHRGWFASPEYRTFRCRDGMLHSSYLRQFVGTEWFQSQLTKLTRGQGARRERLRPEMLTGMMVRMPSISHQKRALLVHEQVERLRALGGPLSADLDALNPAMLHEIFGSRERAA